MLTSLTFGQAGGVAAAYAIINHLDRVDQILQQQHLQSLQTLVKSFTPLS